jgi:hypothetical protein
VRRKENDRMKMIKMRNEKLIKKYFEENIK